jgi:hypothetical protein
MLRDLGRARVRAESSVRTAVHMSCCDNDAWHRLMCWSMLDFYTLTLYCTLLYFTYPIFLHYSYMGCDCPDGFLGPICEYTKKESQHTACTLECQNNGFCRKGAKDISVLEKYEQINGGLHRLLTQSADDKAYAGDFEHCVCPKGYVGLQCEYKMDVCPGGDQVCLNGADCVPYRNEEGLQFQCDCATASDNTKFFAGKYCEYSSTEICSTNGQVTKGSDSYTFCVNDGECVDNVDESGESKPECECKDGFEGDHCEFRIESSGSDRGIGNPATPVQQKTTNWLVLLTVIFAVLATLIFLFFFCTWRRYRRFKFISLPPYITGSRSRSRPAHSHMLGMAPWTYPSKDVKSQQEDKNNLHPTDHDLYDADDMRSFSSMSTNRMGGGSLMGFSELVIDHPPSGVVSLMKSTASTGSRSTQDPPETIYSGQRHDDDDDFSDVDMDGNGRPKMEPNGEKCLV